MRGARAAGEPASSCRRPSGRPACDFTLALPNTNVGPFLQWDPAASVPPAGYIGQPAIPHAIVGSATNVFRLSGPNVGGPGVRRPRAGRFVHGDVSLREPQGSPGCW